VIDTYVLVALIVVLGILGAGLGLFAIKRLRTRKAQLLHELAANPRHAGDRAFNRLEMARRELAILSRQGADTSRARELIAQAQAAFDLRQFPKAYELAQSAHEALVHARQTGTLPNGGAAPRPPTASPTPAARGTPGPVGSTDAGAPLSPAAPVATVAGAPPRLAPNRAESQFQIRLLDADLAAARSSQGSPSMVATATALRSQAQGAFDREQYTDALRFALRGRRELGGKVEALAMTPGATAADVPTGAVPTDPSTTAERAASGSRCPQCSYPTRADDAFCRGCGRPLVPTACAKCGASRSPTDTFCGKCGQPFS
jgi:Double zinc ribbon